MALSITANNSSKAAGAVNPTFTATYSGLTNGDTANSLTGSLTLTTAATTLSPVGSYAITPSGQSSTDYTITYHNGTFVINPVVTVSTVTPALTNAIDNMMGYQSSSNTPSGNASSEPPDFTFSPAPLNTSNLDNNPTSFIPVSDYPSQDSDANTIPAPEKQSGICIGKHDFVQCSE